MGIRLVIIEDHLLALARMSEQLRSCPDIEIAATATGGLSIEGFGRLIDENQPDIVLVDLSTGVSNLDAFAAIAALRRHHPEVKVLALVRPEDGLLLGWLTAHRVVGCLFSDDSRTLSLGPVVRKVSEGRLVYSQEIVERLFHLSDLAPTPRQLDVLVLIQEGLSNAEIARQLSISPVTVRNHIAHAYTKLGVPRDSSLNRRVYAANLARRLGLSKARHADGEEIHSRASAILTVSDREGLEVE